MFVVAGAGCRLTHRGGGPNCWHVLLWLWGLITGILDASDGCRVVVSAGVLLEGLATLEQSASG